MSRTQYADAMFGHSPRHVPSGEGLRTGKKVDNNPFNTQEAEWDAYMAEQDRNGKAMRETAKKVIDEFFKEAEAEAKKEGREPDEYLEEIARKGREHAKEITDRLKEGYARQTGRSWDQ